MKKLTALLLAAVIIFGIGAVPGLADGIKAVEVDGKQVQFSDVSPVTEGGSVLIPARFVTEAMGLEFNWYPAKKIAEIIGDSFKAVLTVDSSVLSYTEDGKTIEVSMDAKTVLKNNRMLCPEDGIRLIAKMTGFDVMSGDVNGSLVLTSAGSVKAVVNGKTVSYTGCAPAVADGAVMFPVRFVTESMGLKFSWYPALNKAVVSDGKKSVDLEVNQRVIRFGGSIFTADRNIILNGNRMYATAASLKRLAVYFGAEADFEGKTLTISTGSDFTVSVNGSKVVFRETPPVEWNGVMYIPIKAFAEAMNLEYQWQDGAGIAVISSSESGGQAVIGTVDSYIDANGRFIGTEEKAEIINGQICAAPDMIIKLAGFFGGYGTLNKYGSGIIISLDQPYTVKVNGVIVTFPDVQPENGENSTLIPLRMAAEDMGLEFLWHREEQYAEVFSKKDSRSLVFYAWTRDIKELENGLEIGSMEAEAEITLKENRLMVSAGDLKNAAEFFGMEVDIKKDCIDISDPDFIPEGGGSFVAEPDEPELSAQLDGVDIIFPDAKPCIVDDRTLFPVRAVAESMKLAVEWDGENRVVTINNGNDSLKLTIDSREMHGVKDGMEADLSLDVPAVIIDDRTCVPIRAVMEFFGAKVDWDNENRRVLITSPKQTATVSSKNVESADAFSSELGFMIDAPLGAAEVSYSIVNSNTARVKYRVENIDYYFSASSSGENVVISKDEFSGPRLNYKSEVNGVPTTISAGNLADGNNAAQWEIGAYKFSLITSAPVEKSVFFAESLTAAKTFVLTREVEPEENNGVEWKDEMLSRQVASSREFGTIGILLDAPQDAVNRTYSIIGGEIAEAVFYEGNCRYVLRGAETDGDISGIEEEFAGGYEVYRGSSTQGESTIIARKTKSGKRLASWKYGSFSFILYTEDQSVSDLEFGRVSEASAANCGFVEKSAE